MGTRGLQKDEEGKGGLESNWQAHILSLEARARCRCKKTLRTFFPWTFGLILQRPSQASQPRRKQFLLLIFLSTSLMSDFFAEGQCNRAEQRPRKNEGYLPCTHSFFIKKMIDLLKCGLKSALNFISTIQIIYWKLASNHSQKLEMGGDNDDSSNKSTEDFSHLGAASPCPLQELLEVSCLLSSPPFPPPPLLNFLGTWWYNYISLASFFLALFCHVFNESFIATPSSQGSSFSDLVRLVAKSRAQMSPPPLFASNISLIKNT